MRFASSSPIELEGGLTLDPTADLIGPLRGFVCVLAVIKLPLFLISVAIQYQPRARDDGQNTNEMRNRRALSVFACAPERQGQATGCRAFCLPPHVHAPASRRHRAREHGGEALLCRRGTKACLWMGNHGDELLEFICLKEKTSFWEERGSS